MHCRPLLCIRVWQPAQVFLDAEALEETVAGDVLPANAARKMIEDIRKRKGLPLEAKVVEGAEKQRNMTRMK